MAQLFSKNSNRNTRYILLGGVLAVGGAVGVLASLYLSPYWTRVGVRHDQPVPFSHEHHVRGLGIDCRYCHTSVEKSRFAGIPPAKTCMTCHSQIWTNADMLAPVREAYRTGKPIPWTRIHNLPDYVYFNHSIHVAKGVACITCHGPIDKMPLTYQAKSLNMSWCLSCHRNPAAFIQSKETVFQTTPQHDPAKGKELCKRYNIRGRIKMEDCYTCHR